MCCDSVAAQHGKLVFGKSKKHPIKLQEICVHDLPSDGGEATELCVHGFVHDDAMAKVLVVGCGNGASEIGESGKQFDPLFFVFVFVMSFFIQF